MRARRRLACAFAVLLCLLAAIAAGSVAVAAAEPPTITLTEPANGLLTKDSTPTLSGGTNEGLTPVIVQVSAGESVSEHPLEVPVTPIFGNWSTSPELADGVYTVRAVQKNFFTEEEGASLPATFTVDTTKPLVSIEQITTPSNNATPLLKGTAGGATGDVQTVTVAVHHGSNLEGIVAAKESVAVSEGKWSWVTTPALADGEYTAHAVQEDKAGNVGGSAEMRFTVRTVKPTVTLTAPEFTKSTTPTLIGHAGSAAEENEAVQVEIFEGTTAGGSPVVSGTASLNGNSWSYTPSTLAPKTYTAVATQRNRDGETGVSEPSTFTVDTTPPVVTLEPVPTPTNNATPTLIGTGGTAPGDDGTVTIAVHYGKGLSGEDAATAIVAVSNGKWSWVTMPALKDGEYTAHVVQEDKAGNVGGSIESTFFVVTSTPKVTLEDPKSGSVLQTARPVFDGKASEGALDVQEVTLTVAPIDSETGVQTLKEIPVTGGKWTTAGKELKLADGEYKAVVEQRDKAGNVGTSTQVTFTIKTIEVTLNASGLISRGAQLVSNATPSFSGKGTAPGSGAGTSVALNFYLGTSSSGAPVRALSLPLSGTTWSSGPVATLPDGTYTVQAEQADGAVGSGVSKVATFTVDADPPSISLSSPSNGATSTNSSQTVSGSAGDAPGDAPSVTIELFAGGSVGEQAPMETVTVPVITGSWSAGFAGLGLGAYTVRAQQSDDVGNTGSSAPVTFTVIAPPPPQGPTASFSWLPAAPHTGEAVSLFSTSTDFNSPITGFAWALTPTGAFLPGKSVLSTSFRTPGKHVVRLRITDASGATNTVAETITVTSPALSLMQPFPVVRIAGTEGTFGVDIRLLTVESPIGAKITVICHGPGCPRRSQNLLARRSSKTRAGSVVIAFRRFERSLRPGAVLEVRVVRAGQIGKYMSFTIRHGKLPKRHDACVGPTGGKPFNCPAS